MKGSLLEFWIVFGVCFIAVMIFSAITINHQEKQPITKIATIINLESFGIGGTANNGYCTYKTDLGNIAMASGLLDDNCGLTKGDKLYFKNGEWKTARTLGIEEQK